MYSGSDPRNQLDAVLRRQEEIRTQARREAMSGKNSRSASLRSPVAFKFWRLHVLVWFDEARRA